MSNYLLNGMFRRWSSILLICLSALFFAGSCSDRNNTEPSKAKTSEPDTSKPNHNTGPPSETRQGRIVYKLGEGQRGLLSYMFNEFGENQQIELRANFTNPNMSKFPPVNLGYVRIGTTISCFDLDTRKGDKAHKDHASFGLCGELRRGNFRIYRTKDLSVLEATRLGSDRVSGLKCQVWQLPDQGPTVCMHRGVMLKTTQIVAGQPMSMVATKVNLDKDSVSDPIQVPSDVRLTKLTMAEITKRKGVEAIPEQTLEHLPQPK